MPFFGALQPFIAVSVSYTRLPKTAELWANDGLFWAITQLLGTMVGIAEKYFEKKLKKVVKNS